MNGVIGLTGLLLDTELTETQRQYAEGVRGSGEALLTIINDILDFSKIEAGKMELEMVDFDLAQAMHEVAALVAEPARAKDLKLVVDCRPEVSTLVRGDVGPLRQILLNLVSNAVKFTSAGEVVLRASLGDGAGPTQVAVHQRGIYPRVRERSEDLDSSYPAGPLRPPRGRGRSPQRTWRGGSVRRRAPGCSGGRVHNLHRH